MKKNNILSQLFYSFIVVFCLMLLVALSDAILGKGYLALFVDTLIYVSLAIVGWKFFVRRPIRELTIIPAFEYVLYLFAGIIITFCAIFVAWIILDTIPMHLEVTMVSLITVFIASFREEVFFRGFYLRFLSGLFGNIYVSICISSVVFGFAHIVAPTSQKILLSFLGCILALGTVKTNSIWLSVGIHFVWNSFFGQIFQNFNGIWLPNILSAIMIGIFVLIYVMAKDKIKIQVA